jgi:predicted RNase H-like nuclease
VRFVGVDLAWTRRGGSGVCVVADGGVRGSGRVVSDQELLAWLAPLAEDDALVAVDAPLIVRNQTGRRPAEQAISRCFGAYHASAHSANLGLPSFRDGVRGEWLARALGFDVDPFFAPGVPLRRAIEVYPHTAIVALFDLASTLKYKAKPGRTLASRSQALAELLRHLETLCDADPPLDVTVARRWRELNRVVRNPGSGAALARAEDEIDAYVCAYTGLYYWTHGADRCRVAGTLADGYIVTPVTPELGACLDRVASEPRAVPAPTLSRPPAPAVGGGETRVALNAGRVRELLPRAQATVTAHVAEFVVEGEDGVIVLVTAETIELRLPTTEWTHGTHGPAAASRLFRRLESDGLSDARLASELERARAARRSEFAVCRYCGRPTPPEHRTSTDVCHSCASEHEHVVF